MADNSKIEWCDSSWSPIRASAKEDMVIRGREVPAGKMGYHCERISPGCARCYASTMNGRMLPAWGTGLDFTVPNREKVEIFLDEEELLKPLKWKKPRRIFVESMSDWCATFVTDEMRDRILAVAALCPQHTFLFLSKRSDINARYLNDERRASFVTGEIRRIADSWQWRSMADAEKARERSNARGRLLQGFDDYALPQSRGIQEYLRISPDQDHDQRQSGYRHGTQASLDVLPGTDSAWAYYQPSEWREGRQQDREPRTCHILGTEDSRAYSPEREQDQAERIEKPQDQTLGVGCSCDERQAQARTPSDGYSGGLQNGPEGSISHSAPPNLEAYLKWPLPNIHLGFSAENQECFDARWAHMHQLAAAGWKVWVSAEPLLAAIDMRHALTTSLVTPLVQVVVGGESGHGARPCSLNWIRSIVLQCASAGVACFVKQLGAKPNHVFYGDPDKTIHPIRLKDRKGGKPLEWPEDLRVRQFPEAHHGTAR